MPTDLSPEAVARRWITTHVRKVGVGDRGGERFPDYVRDVAALIRAERRRCARVVQRKPRRTERWGKSYQTGGHARAEALAPDRRSEIAAKAAAARWGGPEPPMAGR